MRPFLFAAALLLPTILPSLASAQSAATDRPLVYVIYFIPADRQAEPDHAARVERVMELTREFYRDGMRQNGYADRGFELERDAAGRLRLHEVRGKQPSRFYGRDGADRVKREVSDALATAGLDAQNLTMIVFQTLLEWQGSKAIEIGPYVGGGGPRAGAAYVFDDARLDPKLLTSKEPGGYYQRPCSIGQFNTHYIGGVIHELGHAFGLPHDKETDADAARLGSSIMGGGNHTFGRELRGEGQGAFLSPASALPLSVHPLFTGRSEPAVKLTLRLGELQADVQGKTLSLSGKVTGEPKPVGIAARNDPRKPTGDYDAVGWVCPVNADGAFRLSIGELKQGEHDLRLAIYAANGDSRRLEYPLRVDASGKPDLAPIAPSAVKEEAMAAFRQKDFDHLQQMVDRLNKPDQADALRMVRALLKLREAPATRSFASLPANAESVLLADMESKEAKVGWGEPLRNRVLDDDDSILLEVDGYWFESGLFAHAPARHVYEIGGQWKTFETKFGVQDGKEGTVVFVVRGDGKELFRSEKIRAGSLGETKLDVKNVQTLELIVEDGGDGKNSDWGVWLEPRVRR
jgi:hypothetical protein